MKKFILIGALTFLFTTSLAFADNSNTTNAISASQQASQKDLQLSDNMQPPGFQNSGRTAEGLTNQGKTPYGWSQGKKKGWHKNRRKHYDHDHDNNWHGNQGQGNQDHDNNEHGNH